MYLLCGSAHNVNFVVQVCVLIASCFFRKTMFNALIVGRFKSSVEQCGVLQSPPQPDSFILRIRSPEQFLQAVAALSHTSSFWDVAKVVHCSARYLPGRTLLEAVPRNPGRISHLYCVRDAVLGCICKHLWLAALPDPVSGSSLG